MAHCIAVLGFSCRRLAATTFHPLPCWMALSAVKYAARRKLRRVVPWAACQPCRSHCRTLQVPSTLCWLRAGHVMAGKGGHILTLVHAGGMECFVTKEDLREYLDCLNKCYGNLYADSLWRHQVNARSILKNASVEALMRAGVTEELHASDIAQAATSGEVEAVLLAAHLVRPSPSMHLVSAESNVNEQCFNHWLGPLRTNSRDSSWLGTLWLSNCIICITHLRSAGCCC